MELYDLVEGPGAPDPPFIVIDFIQVKFFSSAVFGKLISFDKKVKRHKGELILCDIKPEILEIFSITRLDRILCIEKDREEAIKAIQPICRF